MQRRHGAALRESEGGGGRNSGPQRQGEGTTAQQRGERTASWVPAARLPACLHRVRAACGPPACLRRVRVWVRLRLCCCIRAGIPVLTCGSGAGLPQVTVAEALAWARDHLLTERPELFMKEGSVRPGVLVLINDVDWELWWVGLCSALLGGRWSSTGGLLLATWRGGGAWWDGC